MSPEGGRPPGNAPAGAGEIYVEFIRQGNAVRATAIDPLSGTEASIVGPATAAQSDLQALAVAKLRGLLGQGRKGSSSNDEAPANNRRGIIV